MRTTRFLLVALAFAGVFLTLKANDTMDKKTDSDGHVLTARWAEFEKASQADRPQKMMSILTDIKEEAFRKRASLDFYDAGKEYIDVAVRRNWKLRDSLQRQFAEEVARYDEAIVTYEWMKDFKGASTEERWAFVKAHEKAFTGINRPFWRSISGMMGGSLTEFLADDHEYVLWDCFRQRYFNPATPEKDEIYSLLEACVKGRYPNESYLRYYVAQRLPVEKRRAALETLASEWQGKAMAFWPRQNLLRMDFDDLYKKHGTSSQYRELRDRCAAYEKERGRLTDREKIIARGCTDVKSLISTLEDKDLGIGVSGNRIRVTFQNLPSATVTLRSEAKSAKTLLKKTVQNPKNSFFVTDTAEIALPDLPDGSYILEAVSGKVSASNYYSQHRYSLATRNDARGITAYAADYKTGEPVQKARIVLWKGDTETASEALVFDGFTPLPASIDRKIRENDRTSWSITVRSEDGRKESHRLYVRHDSNPSDTRFPENTWCHVYRDRGAYNPGDTVSFKLVLSKGNLYDRMGVLEGEKLTVTLYDSERKEIARKDLTTGAFGSCSGSFGLPKGLRNGFFTLEVKRGRDVLNSDSFRVDEFVLPTFSLTFDPNETLYLPGDEVLVSGKVMAFSGHSLSGARLKARITRYGSVISEQEIQPAGDGTFKIRFIAPDPGRYYVEISVIDATGETLDFSTSRFVQESIRVSARVQGAADGEFVLARKEAENYRNSSPRNAGKSILTEDRLVADLTVTDREGSRVPMEVHYALLNADKKTVFSGKAASGSRIEHDLSRLPSGLYTLRLKASTRTADKREIQDEADYTLLRVRESDAVLSAPLSRVVFAGPNELQNGEAIKLRLGTTDGDIWALVAVFGKNREVLATRRVHLEGIPGKKGSLTDLSFPYQAGWPDAVRLQVFWFKEGESIRFDRQFRRKLETFSLPLAFSSLTDKAFPGTEYKVQLKTAPGVEALVSIYDKSIDAIAQNHWSVIYPSSYSAPYVSIDAVCGRIDYDRPIMYDMVMEESSAVRSQKVGATNGVLMKTRSAVPAEAMESELADTAPAPMAASAGGDEGGAAVAVREKFETALAFLPHLLSDAAGNVEFSFRTSDKLSTYHVDVYAHDKVMHNRFLRQDIVVSIPVKVAVNEPRYLYAGDNYNLTASVSSNTDKAVPGRLILQVFPDGAQKPSSTQYHPVTVPAGGVSGGTFSVAVPSGIKNLSFKIAFLAGDGSFSDAVKVDVPVKPTDQTLTEAHSAVLRDGMDREALLYNLRKRFVNIDGKDADLREITLIDMVREALPDHIDPKGNDVLSLSEAWYARKVASTVSSPAKGTVSDGELLERILSCRNRDGGFAWFEGMNSSPIITAVMMERFAKIRSLGFDVPDLSSSASYLDHVLFERTLPYWCGWISDEQYLYARSLYPSVPFDVSPATKDGREHLSDFRKWAKDYLVPSKARGLTGQILGKARRIMTLRNLLSSEKGISLAKDWGVKFGTVSKMQNSVAADVVSLLEYAVEHRDGGWYYPNAVLPFRGLLESEAYAHSLLCDLLTAIRKDGSQEKMLENVSDGIRLWLMLQKETQKWDESPAYVDALTSILHGSEAVLNTKVLALSATFTKPFSKLKAAGNGFTIDRKFFRAVTVEEKYNNRTEDKNREITEYQEIRPGDPVTVGEKIYVRYEIWNQENRSFVRLRAPREAAFTPVDQLSGHYGWWLRPLSISGGYSFTPQGYRNVKADCTEYYFDSYPEEKTTVSETFFVTRSGSFSAPVVEIESLYAPHYRANGSFEGVLPALQEN